MNARALGLTMTVAAVLLAPTVVSAQIGIGPRISFVRGTDGRDEDSQTYFGGALRLGGGKAVLELALDYRSDTTSDELRKVTDYPFQASLIVFPIRSAFAPYLIGGVGWYSQKIEQLASAAPVELDVTTRKLGYHGGFGAEMRLHRNLGLYGDYRYTFIHFGDDDDTVSRPGLIPFAEQLRLSHEGSMFTFGATFYF